MPSAPLGDEVPLRCLKPDSSLFSLILRVFGCVAFVQDLSPGLDKLSLRSIKCIFVGYSRTQRGSRCFHPPTRRYFVSADVTFFEYLRSCVPLPSVVDLQNVDPQGSSSVPQKVFHPLQVYQRRNHTPGPPTTEPSFSTDANPSSSPPDLPIGFRKGTRSSTAHPISHFVSYDSLHPRFRSFTLSLSSESILLNHQEALSFPH